MGTSLKSSHFVCQLTFAAAGGEFGDLVQVRVIMSMSIIYLYQFFLTSHHSTVRYLHKAYDNDTPVLFSDNVRVDQYRTLLIANG